MPGKQAVIIGAGPAGLTAALELLRHCDIVPIVLEAGLQVGGISRTIQFKGNRMDIGGHRFFSKNDWVMNWWAQLMPPQVDKSTDPKIHYQNQLRDLPVQPSPALNHDQDLVMLVRPRKSRIYFLRKFFDYPITLSYKTIRGLGVLRTFKIATSYLLTKLKVKQPETNLEEFLTNRFGRQLYLTFFKSYTEKVWGIACNQISAEWGAQRIDSLSLTKTITHIIKKAFQGSNHDVLQKNTETSLIEQFLYPKYGPGQLWEHVASLIRKQGGSVLMGWRVDKVLTDGETVVAVEAINDAGEHRRYNADYVFSTMPVRDLVNSLDVTVPSEVREVSDGLMYRDFVTVGLLVKKLRVTEPHGRPLKDTWIYIQDPDVMLGRLQIFNNWSPYMVADPTTTWIGLEYFCYDTDDLWKMPDDELRAFAIHEVEKIGILSAHDVIDGIVVRVPKTYPAYFGTYDRFHVIREYMDHYHNLFLVGRNGMHKYNNQDHSMLTAKAAVDNIVAGRLDKSNVWEVNTEQEYHEAKK